MIILDQETSIDYSLMVRHLQMIWIYVLRILKTSRTYQRI